MAKSPAEVLKNIAMLHQNAIYSWEADIDKALVDGKRTFAVAGRHRYVVDTIMKSYRTTGWRVDLIPDPRDGAYLQFSASGV